MYGQNTPPPTPLSGPTMEERPAERTRELYKYFQPFEFRKEFVTSKPSSRDTTLTAFAQLVTWRLDARRCTISYFDQDTQYNVAEATKTLCLQEGVMSEEPVDNLWMGCVGVSVQDSICLHTLRAEQSYPDGGADFEAADLPNHPVFSKLPFVGGPPHIKYYYATTFKTKKGVTIGTVCVLDDKVRPPMTGEQRQFLHTIANNVMSYLELLRDRSEFKRAMKMNQCLTLFVNPDSQFGKRRRRSGFFPENVSSRSRVFSSSSPHKHTKARLSPKKRYSNGQVHSSDSDTSEEKLETDDQKSGNGARSGRKAEDTHLRIFRKAARLLRSSLDVEEGGGVVFLDTANAGLNRSGASSRDATEASRNSRSVRRGSTCFQAAAEVLASSITQDDTDNATSSETSSQNGFDEERNFTPLPIDSLSIIIERYPQGKLWIFDAEGHVVSDDSENDAPIVETRLQAEAAVLLQHFPGANQILSIPLWDPRSARWCICFAYSTSKFRTFTFETDFLYCVAFCNCVTIEMARLATLAADRLKGDFISSISHELRSPLHGILASCEFLDDTEASSFQQSLVHTVSSCARTLLDTISMILDYSKINAFERDWKAATRAKRGAIATISGGVSTPGALVSGGQQLMNIYGNVELAAVTEEVVEGVTAGHQHQDILVVDFGDAGSKSRGRVAEQAVAGSKMDAKSLTNSATPHPKGKVEVILDIEHRSWAYVTQPGAFRRVIMNLVGNSLKYTHEGWIRIHLDVQTMSKSVTPGQGAEREAATDTIVLTVTDTGKGISPEYLRTKLFTPFAQEDHLASGTGLGLSLVRSILRMLNGEIDITSTLNSGTKVTVKIPMIPQSSSGPSSASNTPSTGSSDAEKIREDSLATIRSAKDKRFALYSPIRQRTEQAINGLEISSAVHRKLKKYLVEWYKLSLIEWTPENDADVVITDEDDLPSLLAVMQHPQSRAILVYCNYTSRPALIKKYGGNGRMDFMSKPFGPYKVARALCVCLERSAAASNLGLQAIPEPSELVIPDTHTEALLDKSTISSHGVQVNVIECGGIVGKDDSPNAHLALEDAGPILNPVEPRHNGVPEEAKEFPFDGLSTERVASPGIVSRPTLRDRRTMSPTASELHKIEYKLGSQFAPVTTAGVIATPSKRDTTIAEDPSKPPTPREPSISPRLLLVDDNAINLRLLQMFMKKRKYTSVISAQDGIEAVEAFEAAAMAGTPPDLVFLDISMPRMNGFEACRQIRALEEARAAALPISERRASALIIALTGLASSKDQSEAFVAGVDVFMSKPVSFKEVGRLLDNWVRNGGAGREVGVPRGAVTAGTVSGGAEVMTMNPEKEEGVGGV